MKQKDTLKSESSGYRSSKSSAPKQTVARPSIRGPHQREMDRYQTESDLRTLHEAEAIRCDDTRMNAVKGLAKQHLDTLKKVVKK